VPQPHRQPGRARGARKDEPANAAARPGFGRCGCRIARCLPFFTRRVKFLFTSYRRNVMQKLKLAASVLVVLFLAKAVVAETHIYVADHNIRKLLKLKEDGTVLWEF